MSQYNKYNAACPEETKLIAYKNGTLLEEDKQLLPEHLLLCDLCALALDLLPSEELEYVPVETDSDSDAQLIPAILRKAVEDYQRQISAEPKSEPRLLEDFLDNEEELKVGQIWRTRLENIIFPSSENEENFSVSQLGSVPHLVVITNPFLENIWTEDNKKYQIIKVVPVSDNIECAADGDIVFSKEESPLSYPFMLQIWNEQQMIMDNLDACLAKIEVAPESFKSIAESGTTDVINFLTNRGKQQVSDVDSDFSFFGLLKKGIYSDSKMRFRAREFENTAYLRDPVLELRQSLVLAHEPVIPKQDIWDKVQQFFVNIFEMPEEILLGASEGQSEFLENQESFFNGKLIYKENNLEDTGREKEIVFQAHDSGFADKFILLGSENDPVKLIAVLSINEGYEGYTSILNLKDREITKLCEKLLEMRDLSELFDSGKITEKIIVDSISRTDDRIWRDVLAYKEISENLKAPILKYFNKNKSPD